MGRFFLSSILVVPFLIARFGAGLPSSRKAFRTVFVLSAAFSALYVMGLLFLRTS